MPRAFFAWCRGKGRFASFDALVKGRGRGHPCEWMLHPARAAKLRRRCGRYVCRLVGSILLPDARQPTGMPAAFTGEEIPCRPKGWPAFRGGPRNRDFSRKKRFFSTRVLAASEIATGNFDAAAQPKQKSPGWPASNFRARSQRDIYGTFCPGPICPGKAGRRRECYRSTGSASSKQAAGKRRTAGVNGPAT